MDVEILEAVKRSDTVYLEKCLDSSNINKINAGSQSLLMMATYQKDYEMALFLVKKGANPNQQDEALNSPFLYAGASGYLDMVKLYLAYGARFDTFDSFNNTALIAAVEKGQVDVVRLLANTKNFPIDHINKFGRTALLQSVILDGDDQDQIEIVSILLKAGADKNISDPEGKLPIEYAKDKGVTEIISLLL